MSVRILGIVTAGSLLAASLACGGKSDSVERQSTIRQENAGTTTETKSESKQVGNTLEAKTETKVEGKRESTIETFVGTVTKYQAGKSIELMTGEKKTTEFELDQKHLTASVDPSVVVGSRVRLTRERGSGDEVTIRVSPDHS